MFITKLGLRNLFRHKKRTIITSVVISLAIFIYLITDSIMIGFQELSYNNIIDLQSGHLQVVDPDYWEDKERSPLEELIIPTGELKNKIKGLNNFESMAEQLRFSARLNNGIDELPVTGMGIRPEQYLEVFKIGNYFIEGNMFKEGEYKAVMGQSLAELMDLNIGDYVTILTRTKEGAFNTIDAQISGLLKTPNPSVNENTVYLPLSIVHQALNLDREISQVMVRLKGGKYQAEAAVKELREEIKNEGLEVYTWKDSARSVMAMMQAQQVESTTVLGIILIIAAVGIINTTILSALERMEEIGMMKALGLKEGEIIRAFMVEAAGIGIIGGLIGWALSAISILYFSKIGISMNSLGGVEVDFGFPIVDKIYGGWNFSAFLFVFVFGVVVAILASILPARWAARKDPVKAIYHR